MKILPLLLSALVAIPVLGQTVSGPASSTAQAVARFRNSTGKNIDSSNVGIDDTGNLYWITGTGTLKLNSMNSAARDGLTPQAGMIIFNTTTATAQIYQGGVWVDWGSGGGGADADAIHDNVSGEIAAVADKATPVGGDHLLIEDSAAGNSKKDVTIASLESALEAVIDIQDLQGQATVGQVPHAAWADTATTATNAQTATTLSGVLSPTLGGLGVNPTTYVNGLIGILASTVSDVDTMSELETALGGVNILESSEIDTATEFFAIMTGFTGTGNAVRSISPTMTGTVNMDQVRANDYYATNGIQVGTRWAVSTNDASGAPIETFGSTTGKKITLYDSGGGLHYGFGIDTATLRYDVGATSAKHAWGYGKGSDAASTNWMALDSSALRVGVGLVLSNTPAGVVYNPGSGAQVTAAAVGNGVKIDSGFLKHDFPSSEGGTNNSDHAFGALKILNTYSMNLSHLGENTVVIDLTKTNAYRLTATNTINISFAALPSNTNLQYSPVFVYITNTASVSTNNINVTWPTADSDWVGEVNPQLPVLKTTVLRFWYAAGRVFGDYDQPHLLANEFETGTLSASSATTNYIADLAKEGAVVNALANDLFLYTTNRPTSEYASAKTFQLLVRASGANRNIQLHSSMNPPMDDQNYTYVLTNGTAAMISLTCHGPSETNTYFALRRFK